jgi:hypothetical protein
MSIYKKQYLRGSKLKKSFVESYKNVRSDLLGKIKITILQRVVG